MDNKKKILFFTSGAVGGAERVTLTIAKMLPREEYDVKVIYVCRQINNLDKFVPDWMPTIHVRIKNILDFVTLRLYSLIKREKPYAVFCSHNYLNVRLIIAAKLSGIKHIIVRNNIGWSRWQKILRTLARISYPYASHIILQTEEMKDEFQSIFPELGNKMHVIPNPIDLDTIKIKLKDVTNPYQEISTKCNYIYVGRIDPIKGIDVLLRAYSKVVENNKDNRLIIVGDYSANSGYYEELQTIIKECRLTGYVVFTGFADNPYKYIKYGDCFVLPSRMEGNPNVLHEAMYLMTPVVSTRSIPIIDQIVTAERGYVVDVDDIEALSIAMMKAPSMKINTPYNYIGGKVDFIKLFG